MTELQPWRLKRRQAIVAAAARLFAREAFDHVQMDEIARQADVGKPTLYRYFPSKQELYLAVCEDAFRGLERRLAEAARGYPPSEGLRRIVASLVIFLDEQMSTLDVFGQDQGPLPEGWRALFRRHRQAIVAPLRAVLKAGLEQSEFHNLDIDIAPGLIIGAIRGGLISNAGMSRKRLIEHMTAFVFQGLSGEVGDRRTSAPRAFARSRGVGVS